MNIQNEVWDKMVSEALELIDYIESWPRDVVFPAKTSVLALAYSIVHLENSTSEMEEIVKTISRLERIIKLSKKKVLKIKIKSKDLQNKKI